MAKATQQAQAVRPPPRLRRAYFDCRYGQLHVHNAIPAGGGFDELTTLICIHGAGQTGRVFHGLLADLGYERSIYALDLPGSGVSDPAPGVDPVEASVHAVEDFLDSMRIRRFDLLAQAEGCQVLRRLAPLRAAQLRRVVLLAEPAGVRAGALPQPALQLGAAEVQSPERNRRLADFLSRTTETNLT
ncbi:MAG: alpha/beta fold hydrolase [Pseudomonadota bacterium]